MTDPDVRGFTIFCDDIRNEEAGKSTFVGVYDTTMFLHGEFPFVLPKFAIAIRYLERIGAFTNEEARLRIFLPRDDEGRPSFEGVLPMQEVRQKVRVHPDADPLETQYIQVGTNVMFAPLTIAKPGPIKVRVHCGTEIAKLGSLLVIKSPVEDPKE